ncbi:MAG: asparaginase [Helicobacter sp.]|nr:asparaginase [Helicobacter sp.]
MSLPTVAILSTGGTISGESENIFIAHNYHVGRVKINDLLGHINGVANFRIKEIANLDSSNMTHGVWLELAREIEECLDDPLITGVVLTHGSDTLEESAYFLHLVLKSSKPVVITGAMLPSNVAGSDGLKNLYHAIIVAMNPDSFGKGVMVVMNDKIYSAREVSKVNTLSLESFQAPNTGEMGCIVDHKVFFYTLPCKMHTRNTPFAIHCLKELPKVDIAYSYCDDGSKVAVEAFLKAGAKGIVVAGSGAGSIHIHQKSYLIELLKQKSIVVVKSSRVGSGLVVLNQEEVDQGFISGDNLNPQKARVLLMLALTKTNDVAQIRKYFEEY